MAGKPLDPKKLAEMDKLILSTAQKVTQFKTEAEKEKQEIVLREKGLKALE